MDIGWSELLLIGIVALIVVGPKDLPGMFRTLGRFTAKARSMGREFQRAMDEAARESGVKETADELKAMTSKKNLGLDTLEKAASKFEKWEPTKKPATPKGPATQALADKQAADRAMRSAALADKSAEKPAAKAAPEPKTEPAKAPAAKSKAKAPARKAPAKSAATKPSAAKTASKPAAKKKPRVKKGEA